MGLTVAVAAGLRLTFIARQPIGYDEDFTAVAVHQPLDRMIGIVSHDSAPPRFYLVERAVVALADALGLGTLGGPGGPGGTAVRRLIPALAGIAILPLIAAPANGGTLVQLFMGPPVDAGLRSGKF